jgi:hypothetical protein
MSRWLLGLLLVLVAPSAGATTLLELSEEELVEGADTIVVGRAVAQEVRWVDRTLYTFVTVEVAAALKGAPPQRVTVALPGGVDATRKRAKFAVAMTYAGAPALAVGEEAVLFLTGADAAVRAPSVVGFSQGLFSVRTTPTGKQVTQDLSGVSLRGAEGRERAGVRRSESLESFASRIRALVARGKR